MKILYWMWLMDKHNIGAKKAINLYNSFLDIEQVYNNKDVSRYQCVEGINYDLAKDLSFKKDLSKYEKIYEYMLRKDIKSITADDKEYPFLLKEIYDYPPVLFYRGKNSLKDNKPFISIVGSRTPSAYGSNIAYNLSKDFSYKGVSVVSGLALGIDAMAHKGAIDGPSETVAVLGSGVDVIYPRGNTKLYDEIIEKDGMIVSELLPTTKPLTHHFPARNRIISGLTYGTIIVEASEKSGSLITARTATEQNREVFVVPGNINSRISKGSNLLIRDGAKVLLSCEDVLNELHYLFKDMVKNKENFSKEDLKNESFNFLKQNLSNEEMEICKCVKLGINTVDLLVQNLNFNINNVNSCLTMLELKGIVCTVGSEIVLM